MGKTLRIAIVTLVAVFELGAFIASVLTYEKPTSVYGWLAPDGVEVIQVAPRLPAEKAGIEPGDRVVYETLPLHGRLTLVLNEMVAPGTPLTLQIRHHGIVRSLTLLSEELPELFKQANLAYAFGGLALGAVGIALVLLRPSRMTWGFLFGSPPLLLPSVTMEWAAHATRGSVLAYELLFAFLWGLQLAGLLMFASRFPEDKPKGFCRFLDRIAIPVGAAAFLLYAYVDVTVVYAAAPPPRWMLFTQDYLTELIPSVAAVAAFLTTYFSANREVRNRLALAIACFALQIAVAVAQQVGEELTINIAGQLILDFSFAIATALAAASVAYAVVRHRVIDVNFIISRTLVYTILTAFVVAIFTLIEYFVGKLLERGRLAELLEVGAAMGVGISLSYVHSFLDKFIDVVLFRRRHEAETRLARAAHTLPHATAPELVDEMLVEEAADALDLASAALFRLDGDGYTRRAARGWNDSNPASLAADDHLVLRLRAELAAIKTRELRWPRTDLPGGDAQPTYVVPVVIGHRLEALAIYGAHNGGEDIDPDERRSLRGMAGGAALAYDHLAEQELQAQVDALNAENAMLRQVEARLTSLIKKQLDAPGT